MCIFILLLRNCTGLKQNQMLGHAKVCRKLKKKIVNELGFGSQTLGIPNWDGENPFVEIHKLEIFPIKFSLERERAVARVCYWGSAKRHTHTQTRFPFLSPREEQRRERKEEDSRQLSRARGF